MWLYYSPEQSCSKPFITTELLSVLTDTNLPGVSELNVNCGVIEDQQSSDKQKVKWGLLGG